MAIEEEPEAGIPEWVVTFGDMMSLLLTFFIMLVSLSEIKSDEKYQALVESIREAFGHDMSMASRAPGTRTPHNSELDKLSSMGHGQKNVKQGGNDTRAPKGDDLKVRIIRKGSRTTIGGVVFFKPGDAALSEEAKTDLVRLLRELVGKEQKIEIRGHTALRPEPLSKQYPTNWDLAFARCRAVQKYLEQLGIEADRLRINVAAQYEPLTTKPDEREQKKNPRVEVFLMDQLADELRGPTEERQESIQPAGSSP